MTLWNFLSGENKVEGDDTVASGTQPKQPTSSEQPTVIQRTDADGSTRFIINTNGGNYNERIDGDYIQGQVIRGKT